MNIPEDRKYSKEHEWALQDDDIVTVGISTHAAEAMGDVVFVELPTVGTKIGQFAKFGEIESVKAVSDLFAPVGGEVTEINSALNDDPSLVNQDPYVTGWLIKVKIDDPAQLDKLMSPTDYAKFNA